jgi:hypothetical protein
MTFNIKREYGHFLIPQDQLKEKLTIDGKDYYLVENEQLKRLIDDLKEGKKDINELKNCIMSLLGVLGLLNEAGTNIKESIKTGEESYFKHILKALGETMALLGQAQIPVIGKKAEAKLLEKFHFVKTIIPTIEKYAGK